MAERTLSAEDRRQVSLALLAIALLTLIRLVYLAGERFPLYGDEAQYWAWAKEPAFGYYSKPPMLAWVIWATTSLLGDREFGVRLAAPLVHAGTAMLLMALGARLWSAKAGAWAAILWIALPAVSLSSMVISTDLTLLFFWAAALLAYVSARENDRWIDWLAMGLAIGLGLLSKYAMGFFVASLAVHLLWTGELRRRVTAGRLPAALGVAALIYAPNLWWNVTNGWVSYKHTGDNANLGGPLFHPEKLGDFLGGQFGVFGPIPFVLLLYLIVWRWRATVATDNGRLAVSFILPHLLPIMAIALLSRAHANWAASIYIMATPFVAAWLANLGARRLMIAIFALHVAAAGIAYHYRELAPAVGVALTRKTDPYARLIGFDQAGHAVAHILGQVPDAVVMTEDRMLFALLAFYIRPRAPQVQWNGNGRIDDHFELNTRVEDAGERPILFVTERDEIADVTRRFAAAERYATITIPLNDIDERRFHVWELHGYGAE
jgi:4-amino-4-deoxy-L-arabinose transferase-like glycosyltransferase